MLIISADFPDQERLTLSADIKYKSNWQQGALKASRRNKWICTLKTALVELKIYGPSGNPDIPPPPTLYTKVPYEEIKAKECQTTEGVSNPQREPPEWKLADKNAVIVDQSRNVFGEVDELYMTDPKDLSGSPGDNVRQKSSAPQMPFSAVGSSSTIKADDIEMSKRH
ncbi:hypothetical protein C0992_011068 [Termitomyces sp. T32_za158]|nr:hypothetical protein C0992_011068 [Termitomyces sp. T32_za158]